MKLRISRDWHKKEEHNTLLFFAQKLDEMFFDYSLDTYKPPALTSASLCNEAIALIRDIEDDLIDRNNLPHVLEELDFALRRDMVAKMMINAPVEKFVLKHDGAKLAQIKVRLEVLRQAIGRLEYIELCEFCIKEAIQNNAKSDLVELARLYASTLIGMSISKQHLNERTTEFFFRGAELTSIENLDEYFKLVSPTTHHFEIYFVVSNMILDVHDSIEAFQLAVVDIPPQAALDVATAAGLLPEADEVWVEVKQIEACDRHTARIIAEASLSLVRDMFLLFSHKNRISWRQDSLITQCCDDIPVVIREPKNAMEKCFDLKPKVASRHLNNLIKHISLEGSSFRKFNRAVDLHGLG